MTIESAPTGSPTSGTAPTETHSDHPSAAHDLATMFAMWVAVWNGDTATAPRIISPDFQVHAALLDGTDGSSTRGVEGLVGMVGQMRAAFTDLQFSVEVGPLIDGHHVSGRWVATGSYAGGFPGAKAEPGTVITFAGTDTLRVEHGQFVEYWFNADTLSLLQQLRVL